MNNNPAATTAQQWNQDAHAPEKGSCKQERRHEHVRACERSEERRDEPAVEARGVAAVVEDEVLGQPAGAVVVVAEVLVEVVDDRRVTPPGDRHEEVVEEPEHRDRSRGTEERPDEGHELLAAKDDRPAEEVRTDRNEVVLEREPDRAVVGGAVEPALGQHRVEADDQPEHRGEHVARVDRKGKPP